MRDPIRSEQGMFELLLWVVGVAVVLIILVVLARAIF